MEPSGEHDPPDDEFDAVDPVATGVAAAPVGVGLESVETVTAGGSAATVTKAVPVEVTTTVLVEVPLATGVTSAAAATVATVGEGSEISSIQRKKDT